MIAAVDPGARGAIVWLSRDGHLIDVQDMPTVDVRGKLRVSAQGVADLLKSRVPDMLVVEGVGAMPGNGSSSMFNFGYSAGLIEGVAAGMGVPLQIVRASEWKKKAGVPADKGAARQMAIRLWPGAADVFKRVKDDGRAEAALMGRWAALTGL